MKTIKNFKAYNETYQLVSLEDTEDDKKPVVKMDYHEAFELFIKGQKAMRHVSIPAHGDSKKPWEERYYGDGVEFENGYAFLAYGGGCSGYDCNTYYIVDLKTDRLVAYYNSED